MTTLNNYIFLDEDNLIIDVLVFDEETCTDEVVELIRQTIGASYIIRNDNGLDSLTSIPTFKYFGSAVIGYSWDGVDTFLPPKPGEEYMLNFDRTLWVKIPKINTEEEVV
jgi:hypothetical protein